MASDISGVRRTVSSGLVLLVGIFASRSDMAAQECRGCTLVVSQATELTIPEADGGLWGSPLAVEVDGHGRVWVVFQSQLPAVFDPDGGFLRRVGSQGPGPMEFASVTRIIALPGDSVAVLDPGNARVSVLGPGLEFGRSLRMPVPLSNAAVIRWPGQVLASAIVPTPESAGWPLHMVDFGADQVRVARSFGSGRGEIRGGQADMMALRRVVHASGDRAWVGDRYLPSATRWTAAGEPGETRMANPGWFGDPLAELQTQPIPNAIVGIAEGANDTLILYASVVDQVVLQEALSAARRSGASEVAASQMPPAASYRRTRVLVLEEGGRLVADLPMDGFVVDVASDGRALVARVDALERLRLTLERIEIAGR